MRCVRLLEWIEHAKCKESKNRVNQERERGETVFSQWVSFSFTIFMFVVFLPCFNFNQLGACTFVSPNEATFTVGTHGDFQIILSNSCEQPYITSGTLPDGLNFYSGTFGESNASIAGTPECGSEGTYILKLFSDNVYTPDGGGCLLGNCSQTLTITVQKSGSCCFYTENSASFIGERNSIFEIVVLNSNSSITMSGSLPSGLSFGDDLNPFSSTQVASISGTPYDFGTYQVTLTSGGCTNCSGDIDTTSCTQALTISVFVPVGEVAQVDSFSATALPVEKPEEHNRLKNFRYKLKFRSPSDSSNIIAYYIYAENSSLPGKPQSLVARIPATDQRRYSFIHETSEKRKKYRIYSIGKENKCSFAVSRKVKKNKFKKDLCFKN